MAANPNNTPRHYYSLEEYFALERAGDARYEYWDGDIVCMSGGSEAHGTIAGNVFYRLRQKLEGKPCRVFTADIAVKTPTLLPYRYPDASVVCAESRFENVRGIDALLNPVLIIEVISPTTAQHDRSEKFEAYKSIPGFQEYLLIAQDAIHIDHYVRQSDGRWILEEINDLNKTLMLNCIDCELSVREIYESVKFK